MMTTLRHLMVAWAILASTHAAWAKEADVEEVEETAPVVGQGTPRKTLAATPRSRDALRERVASS